MQCMTIKSMDGAYELDAQGKGLRLKPLKGGLNFKRTIPAEVLQAGVAGEANTVQGASPGVFASISKDEERLLITLRFPDTPTQEVAFSAEDVELLLMM